MVKRKLTPEERKVKKQRVKRLICDVKQHGDCGRRLWSTVQKWEQKATLAKEIFAYNLIGKNIDIATQLAERKGYILQETKVVGCKPRYDTVLVRLEQSNIVDVVF